MEIQIGDYVRMLKDQRSYEIDIGDMYEIIGFTNHKQATLQLKKTTGNLTMRYIALCEDEIGKDSWAVIVEQVRTHVDVSSLL